MMKLIWSIQLVGLLLASQSAIAGGKNIAKAASRGLAKITMPQGVIKQATSSHKITIPQVDEKDAQAILEKSKKRWQHLQPVGPKVKPTAKPRKN